MPPNLANLFARERRRIRRLLCWQFAARLLAAVGAAFWVGLLLDWSFEPSPGVRLGVMIAAGLAIFAWLVQTTLEPLFRRLPDQQLAVLIEQREPAFADSLITAVELAQRRDQQNEEQPLTAVRAAAAAPHPQLAAATTARASDLAERRTAPWLTDPKPTRRWIALALAGLASIVGLGMVSQETLHTYARRLALDAQLWPRAVHLSIDGFVQDSSGVWRKTIARGDSLPLAVRADLSGEHRAPGEVWLSYKDAEGITTRGAFARIGKPTSGDQPHQLYTHTIEEVRSDLRMRIRGGDARLAPVEVTVASRPVVVGAELKVFPPAYLNQPVRRRSAAAAGSLPEGSRVVLRIATSKPLQQVSVNWTGDNAPRPPEVVLTPGERTFLISTVPLVSDRRLEIQLEDTDHIASNAPYPILLAIKPDRPPRVLLEMVGIGAAVTPDARLEMNLTLEDDHALGDARVDLQIDKQPAEGLTLGPLEETALLKLNDSIDLLTRRFSQGLSAGRLQPGQQLLLTAAASDRYDLAPGDRTTTSGQIQLEVVTPDQLLARIEELEINLRRTFEQTVDEMGRARRALDKLPPVASAGANAEPQAETEAEAEANAAQRRRLRQAQVEDELQKITQETLAAAEAFHDIYQQLVHNRIDNTDLIDRIDGSIAQPLSKLGQSGLPTLRTSVAAGEWTQVTAEAALVLAEMERILEQMRSLETYNEVLAILRQVIDDQQRVQRATEQTMRDQVQQLLVE